jgi:Protein of unknown function (DUF1351)
MDKMILNVQAIKVIQGSIEFTEAERIKQQALQLAENLKTVEVNEENLKESKKLLAAVNKRKKELDDERIRIKKLMLEPYQAFEEIVKEILAIVDAANDTVRQQVKDLEEKERSEKQQQLAEIFAKRKALYSLGDLIPFEDFLKPKHLNKTTTIEAVEMEMVDFLEQTERDIKVLQGLPDLHAHVSAYIGQYDLALAMTQVQGEKERRRQIESAQAEKKQPEAKKQFRFIIWGEKDKAFVEMFMQQNKIQYEMEQ